MSGIRTNSASGLWADIGKTARLGDYPLARLRRALFICLVLATSGYGAATLYVILRGNGMSGLQLVALGLFTLVFTWIALAFWTALAGFVLNLLRRDPLTLGRAVGKREADTEIRGRTVLAMPVYNEDSKRFVAGLESTCLSLLETGSAESFEVFVLSDTTDDAIAEQERHAVAALQGRLADRLPVHYRRRDDNIGRKAGNVAEFCTRWGGRYDYMVILDADSVMEGRTLVAMAQTMDRDSRLGLLQTVPIPVRQRTAFGRFLQFAAALYSPMLGAGQAFWQLDSANFWGHNAIIRVRAFMEHCGLPVLPGRPPLGGEILSHDFVEASLLRRAGWEVRLDANLGGSFEEMPSNLLDYAKRDRRWTQGNLQHLRLLFSPGLHALSRLHFVFGAFAYLASVTWLALLLVSTADAAFRAREEPVFFGISYQLYPNWPVAHPDLIISLLLVTGGLLLMPRAMGVILALIQRRRLFGSGSRLSLSAALECLFSVLIAPIMMLFHTRFVLGVLTGYNVVWGSQARAGRRVPWVEALRHTLPATLFGVAWAGLTYLLAPDFLVWLLLVWIGLLLAAPIVRWSSSLALGARLRNRGLLLTPSEVEGDGVLRTLETLLDRSVDPAVEGKRPRLLPPPTEIPGEMPIQRL
ncbi:membrane glycosyltransferase [Natronocella acetinitrilica]|uniref:Glucans biosynthesis glucosyltransferase H n=1 Tax=Natronocella acetinitrilica TaxID=414046 RepID=A0AAE3G8X2_9GAMM|nr:glucans biosynthesis glucosyltransferase MdoH [Natronocella acetinitrilica]MCP1675972.1 membrane glycosyltransferase [Natronocella acetinitrilica]